MFTLRGRLYNNEEQFMANVNYRLIDGASTNVWGELIPIEDESLSIDSGYIFELEDNRKIKCRLQKYFHRALTLPTRYVYRFTGTYPIYSN